MTIVKRESGDALHQSQRSGNYLAFAPLQDLGRTDDPSPMAVSSVLLPLE
jgi:hypothetical protein